MKPSVSDYPWLTLEFFENQKKVPPEMLEPYVGQVVAWNWEGTQILAGGSDRDEVYRKLEQAGIDTSRVIFEYIASGEVSNL